MRAEKGPKKNKERVTRREFLEVALGGVLITGAILWYLKKRVGEVSKETKEKFSLEKFLSEINEELTKIENNEELALIPEQKEEIEKISKEFKENLEKLSYPIKAYFITDNPVVALDTLWEEKNDYIKKHIENNIEEIIIGFREIKLNFLKRIEVEPKGYIEDLEKFVDYIQKCIIESLSILHKEKLLENERYNFDEETKSFILEILKDTEFFDFLTKTLLSLIFVEICNTGKGVEENKKVLTYLLRKYGLRFLSFIPSIYDKVFSIGPFQLSELVIGEEKDKFYPINFINNFVIDFDEEIRREFNLPKYKLPSSLEKFNIRDHFRAEIYLLLFYLLELFREVDLEKIKKTYQKDKKWFYYQLCYYLAGCHHLPGATKSLFKMFLEDEENIENQKSFLDFAENQNANKNLITYLERFRDNLKGAN